MRLAPVAQVLFTEGSHVGTGGLVIGGAGSGGNRQKLGVRDGSPGHRRNEERILARDAQPGGVDTFLGANHSTRTSGGALCTGADGPRPGARLGFPA
jgi:hypothetical protein